jgi:hypothetical protein
VKTANSLKKTGYCLFVLLICCLISYWPLTFHVFSLKNDALNYFLPVRYQISEAIHNGYWPFWSPYFNLGYPLHGDMQSGVWNPFVQIFSLFGPYTLSTLQCETLLYLYLSGVGMFFLINHFCRDLRIALLIGASFMLCGFNSDSTQFLNWICGTSFLPFIFLFYYRTLTEANWKTALACALFLYLMFTTAYPADFILTCYVLLFVLIWFFFQKQNRTKKSLRSQLALHSILFISVLLLSLPAVISFAEFLSLSQRGMGATYAEAMSNPLHPGLIISYLTPLPTWKASFANITDPLERNSYFGLIPFTAFLISFFIKLDQPIARFLKWAFVASLFFSFGEMGGIRVIAYYLLPLMKAFRHPANERLFTIFFACLLAAFSFEQIEKGTVQKSVKKTVTYLVLIAFLALLIWSLKGPLVIFLSRPGNTVLQLKLFLDNLHFSDFLLINSIIQIPFIAAIYFWLFKKMNWKGLIAIALINSIIHTLLFQPLTVVKKDSVASIQSILNTVQKKGYPAPDVNVSLSDNSRDGMQYFNKIGVSNMYNKKIGRVDYRITPSNLLKQNEFWFNTKLRDLLFHYPVFYKADTLISVSDSTKLLPSKKRFILTEDSTLINAGNSDYTVSVRKFTPLNWEMSVESNQQGFYCLFQNDYPRWRLFIDGKPESVERCNIAFIGFRLLPGKHLVSLQYKTADLALAFFVSLISLLVILFLLIMRKVS